MPTLEQVLEQYPQKVKIVFKNYPLNNHRNAMNAAAAALAAEKQGRFWEFHDLLFKNYNDLNDKVIEEIMLSLGLDQARFKLHQNASETLARIYKDIEDGKKANVRGVPAVFVNGILLKDLSLTGFQKEIGAELKKIVE